MIRPKRMMMARAVSVVVLTAAVGVRAAPAGASAKAGADKVVIAALPFTDASPDQQYGPLAEAMGDMLVSFLSQGENWVFVERSALGKVLKEQELSLAMAGMMDSPTKAKVGRLLGAKYLLTGGVTAVDGKLRINAHLFEVATARVARSEQGTGKVDELEAVVGDVARKLARNPELKLPKLRKDQVDKSPQANLHFMRGLGYYYSRMYDHAIVEFMRALNLKPDHARARYWNGRCYFDDKEYAHARIEFERFVRDFPKHPRAPQAKKSLGVCTVQTQKSRATGKTR